MRTFRMTTRVDDFMAGKGPRQRPERELTAYGCRGPACRRRGHALASPGQVEALATKLGPCNTNVLLLQRLSRRTAIS